MPSVAAALLALTMERPLTESGVWLDAPPRPGTVLTAPLVVKGETQATEGVLQVRLYVLSGTTSTEVASYRPTLPAGTIPFSFTWKPDRPGTYTVRVVSTTALRGLSAEVADLRVAAPPRPAKPVARPARPAARPATPAVAAPRPGRATRVAARPVTRRLDDSGRAFGKAAPTLPYARVPHVAPRPFAPATRPLVAPMDTPDDERRGWVSVAGGLLLMLVCSHLHRSLRPQPDPRDTA